MKKLIAYYVSCLKDDGVFEMRRLRIKRAACSISISLFFFSSLFYRLILDAHNNRQWKFNVHRIKFSTKCEPTFWLRFCAFFPMCLFFFHCLYLALSCIFRCYIIVCQGEAQWNKCTGYKYLIIYCLPHRLQQINIFMRTQNITAEKYRRLLVCWVVGFPETFKRIAIYFIIHYDGTVNGFEYHPGSLMCRFSVSLACICILGVHMIFVEIIRIKMRQNILDISTTHTHKSQWET